MTDTAYLERALIGALLNDPQRGPDLPTLSQRDFTDPLCRALWQVLSTETGWPPGPVNVTDIAERLTSLGAEMHPTLRSAAAVAELQVHAPARPHPHTYAQLIIDQTIRRDVLALGYQLTQIDPAHPEQAIATIDAITSQLQAHQARSPLGPVTPLAEHDSISPPGDAGAARPETKDVRSSAGRSTPSSEQPSTTTRPAVAPTYRRASPSRTSPDRTSAPAGKRSSGCRPPRYPSTKSPPTGSSHSPGWTVDRSPPSRCCATPVTPAPSTTRRPAP